MSLKIQTDPKNIFFRCVEDSNEAIMITGMDGKLLYVNPAWSRIYGFTLEEAIGNSPRLLHSGIQGPEFYAEMWNHIRDPEIAHWKGQIINKAKDGRLVPVLLTITPFKNFDGQIEGYMGIALDMSEQKQLEAQVLQQDRLASIGLLASGLAHEIGTPLGVVRGRAEMIKMDIPDGPAARSLDTIISQIDRITKLIRSLLRVSRSSTDLQIDDVSVQDVVDEVFSLVGQNFRQNSIALITEIQEGLTVRADPNRLQQVALNLAMNSIHAIKKAKEADQPGPHRFTIRAKCDGRHVRIEFEDTGCGIPPENMQMLFKPFFTTKDVGEGTGLGLAIVAKLVEEMKGRISAESQVGIGTRFTLELEAGTA